MAEFAVNDREPATFTFTPQQTDRLRVIVTKSNARRIAIQEIEVYPE